MSKWTKFFKDQTLNYYYGFKYLAYCESLNHKIIKTLRLNETFIPNGFYLLDLYPTRGTMSLSLNQMLLPIRHVLMDNHRKYQELLLSLKEAYCRGDSMIVSRKDPFSWESYLELIDDEQVISPKMEKESKLINKSLLVHANLTNDAGYGLLVQWLGCCARRNWLQKYGNVRMLVWVTASTASHLLTEIGSSKRRRNALNMEAFTNSYLVAISESSRKVIGENILSKHAPLVFNDKLVCCSVSHDSDLALIDIQPYHNIVSAEQESSQIVDLDVWEYVAKQLFIQPRLTMEYNVPMLAAGAGDFILPRLSARIRSKSTVDLTPNDMLEIVKLFSLWPFKPDIKLEFVEEEF
ncbi:BA75_04411T0 [Komagataella pastoris]|uniref:rRNA adenine N(6)-methyltransferase n=1 Tax=Komagataella pastoris TaxID=4922 RepID=A0A1B2JI46_PICPA|nr:BA75_04411T0 [Komagataella pastoris]